MLKVTEKLELTSKTKKNEAGESVKFTAWIVVDEDNTTVKQVTNEAGQALLVRPNAVCIINGAEVGFRFEGELVWSDENQRFEVEVNKVVA